MAALLTKTLAVICPSCDFLNVVGAVRCMACGAATDGSAPATRPPSQPLPATSSPSGIAAKEPPGLKRSSPTPPPQPAARGVPARPTFEAPPAQPQGPRLGLTVLAGPARGQRFRIASTGAQLGRVKGAILFPDDPFISPLHATLSVRDGKLFVRDEGSTSGVYASVNNTETVQVGGMFSTGLRLFRFVGAVDPSPPWNRRDVLVYGFAVPNSQVHYLVEEVLLGERPGRCVLSPGPALTFGQSRCDFSFPNDEGLAPRHCELSPLPDGALLKDLSGGLGTFIRISDERALKPGDRLRVGQQTLLVESL